MLDSSDDSDFIEYDPDAAISPAVDAVEQGNDIEGQSCVALHTETTDEDPLAGPSASGGILGDQTGDEGDSELAVGAVEQGDDIEGQCVTPRMAGTSDEDPLAGPSTSSGILGGQTGDEGDNELDEERSSETEGETPESRKRLRRVH